MEKIGNKKAKIKDINSIKIAEIKKGLKAYQVAEMVGVTKVYYSQITTMFYPHCSYELAIKICKVLDLEFENVFQEV